MTKIHYSTVVFLFAHPDDESMFFLPTIFGLIQQQQQQQNQQNNPQKNANDSLSIMTTIVFLCLSNGNYHGLGEIRKQELYRLVNYIQHKQQSSSSKVNYMVHVIDHRELPDSPNQRWSPIVIANVLQQVLLSLRHPDDNLVDLYTFDRYGVSGHVNHVDTHYGLQRFLTTLEPQDQNPIKFRAFQLVTVSKQKKLGWILQYFPIYHWIILLFHLFGITRPLFSNRTSKQSSDNLVVYYFYQPWINWKCMSIHASQFVWYRRLFVVFSCYTYENRWQALEKNCGSSE